MSFAVSLDTALQQRVEHIAAIHQLSLDCVVMQALREYVEREEQKAQFQQEAMTAWHALQQNGLHLTGDEVINWLDSWGTDTKMEMPQCHN